MNRRILSPALAAALCACVLFFAAHASMQSPASFAARPTPGATVSSFAGKEHSGRSWTLSSLLSGLPFAAPPTDFVVPVNPKATYLHANEDPDAVDSTPIDLQANGIQEGDILVLEQLGSFDPGPTGAGAVAPTGMIAVFSSSGGLQPASQFDRVQNRVDVQSGWWNPVVTPNTYWGNQHTDIWNDFWVNNDTGINKVATKVPAGAKFLFVAANDSFYGDNTDALFRVRVTKIDTNFTTNVAPFATVDFPTTFSVTNGTVPPVPLYYFWDFGEGNSLCSTAGWCRRYGNTSIPTHIYTTSGSWTWRVRVSVQPYGETIYETSGLINVGSDSGCSVHGQSFNAQTAAVNTPFGFSSNVVPVNCSTTSEPSVDWFFGDGGSAHEQNPVHTYAGPGSYNWKVVVDKPDRVTPPMTVEGTLHVGCDVNLSATFPSAPGTNRLMPFRAEPNLPPGCKRPILYEWAFGDGTFTAEQNPNHLYTTPGDYTWSVVARIDGQEVGRQSGTITVTQSPIPTPTPTPEPSATPTPTPTPVLDGLVSWWRADGSAADYFGVNSGTFEGGPLFDAGRTGQAFRFNGTSNFVKVPNSPSLNPGGRMSLEFWMKADADNPLNSCCQGLVTSDYYIAEMSAGASGGPVGVNWVTNAGGGYRHTSDPNGGGFVLSPLADWHHVAATYDGATMSLYIDGQLKHTNIQSGDILPMLPGDFLSIGSEEGRAAACPGCTLAGGGPRFFKGLIDEVRFYNRALSAPEVQNNFNADNTVAPPVPTPSPTSSPSPTPTPGATFVVNSDADTDDHVCDAANCTLREAVNAANQTPGTNAINFNIPGAGAHTINATNSFFINKAVLVDATTQPGYAGQPVIEINGAGAGQANGLWVTGGGTRVRGLVINRFFYSAVNLQGNNNVVEGCYIGTNLAGNAASPNGNGVNVQNGADNVIGGTSPAARNVISGNNGSGVSINSPSTGTKVQGNYIGLNAAGTAALPQPNWAPGVGVYTASGNYVGGTEPGAGNVISGNKGAAVFLSNTWPGGTPGASGNFVQGNLIGTGPSGLGIIANEGGTVAINAGSSSNLIGGASSSARNVIVAGSVGLSEGATGNRVQGNYIGLLADGSPQPRPSNWMPGVSINSASGNFIGGTGAGEGNVISANSGPGIWLANMGPNTAGSNNNLIQGNLIGTTPDGLSGAGNWSGGVQLNNGSSNNIIGGTDPAARNVIAGNKGGCTNDECGDGISISNSQGQSNDNVIRSNYIGVNAAGNELKNTGSAITLWGVARTQVVGNIISGSLGSGVSLGSASPTNGDASTHLPTSETLVQGNRIGTNSTGTAAAGHRYNAVSINSSNNNTVVGNVISGSGMGVFIGNQWNNPAGSTGNVLKGNFIGTNFDGTAAIPNNSGVQISNGSSGNTVGGPAASDRNVISGNTGQGVSVNNSAGSSDNNTVQGNYIGVKADGSGALSNASQGVAVYGVSGTQVVGNVISGNNGGGIHIFGASPAQGQPLVPTTNTSVRGNFIGTDPTGTFVIPNSGGVNFGSLATSNTIGGPNASDRNVISGNNGDGVNLGTSGGAASGNTVQGNYIGVNAAGTAKLANQSSGIGVFGVANTQILGNVISGNNGNGISLGTGTVSQGSSSVGANRTVVQGNFIGTNAAGTAAIANGSNGVSLFGAANNQIGGAGAARNIISGNAQAGISFGVAGNEPNVLLPDNNSVQNNYVGVNASGTAAVSNANGGIQMGGSSNNLIEGNVVSGNTGQGVSLNYNRFTNAQNVVTVDRDAAGNVIRANFIGTNAAGTAAIPNTFNGVVISGASNNTIGGLTAADRNVISGNGQAGVSMGVITLPNNVIRQADGNKVLGNYVGVDLNGNAMGNGNGINPSNNQPFNSGGINLSAVTNMQVSGNVVSANRGNGISLNINFVPFNAPNAVADSTGNTVSGNLIGTKPDGTTALGNTGNGVALFGTSNTIGGTAAGAGNVIAFNSNVGISLNCVSPPAGAPASLARCATNNPILSNSFFSNGSIGINLGSLASATPASANLGQAAPSLNYVSVGGGGTSASGVLGGTPSAQFRIEFFANDSCDPSGSGEGQTFIGSAQATAGADGLATFNISSLSPVAAGKVITATATGPNGTSRFSACRGLSPATAKISGRATDQSGNALPGVTVSLNGSQAATATTDAGGTYAFLNVPTNGTYDVSASLAGTTFYPPTYTLTNLPGGDQTVNFTKAAVRYAVTDLGALTPGPQSIGWDVNNAGQVTGWSSAVASTNFHPFFYNGTTLTDIAPLGTGTNALAVAIGDGGRIVGYSELTPQAAGGSFTGQIHAVYSDNGGALRDLGTLGGANSQAWGVNDTGVVVGQSNLAGNTQVRPFIWKDANADGQVQPGEMFDAGQLGSGNSGRLFAINNLGVAVGNSNTTANGVQQATIWKDDNNNGTPDPGELKLLGALGGTFGNASGVNDSGYVVGVAATNLFSFFDGRQLNRAFVWHDDNSNGQSDPGEMKDLGTLGGEISSALRINSAGEIVGNSTTTSLFNASGFLYKNGFMLDLNAAIPQGSGWHITEARGINDGGQIAGYGFLPNSPSVTHALLLTPQTLTSQTVTFDPVPNRAYGDAPLAVNATASSGLPVTYSVVSGPATVNGNTVTINGAGAVTLRASQAGDATYAPASAEQSFTVAPAALRVIVDSKTKLYGAPNPTFTAQYQGFKYGDGPGVLMGTLTFNVTAPDAVGVYTNAIVPGGLSAANYVMQYSAGTLTVEKASTTTTSGNYSLPVPGTVNLVAQVTPDAPSTQTVSGGTVTFTIRRGTTNVAQVTSGAVSAGLGTAQTPSLGTGAYTVYASYSGSQNYTGSTGLASITVGTANPVPSVTGLTPDSAVKKASGTGQFTLLIDGSGFMSTSLGSPANSTVDWYDRTTGQHTSLSVTSITAAQIQAVVPFDLIRAGKTVEVSVANRGPGGGTSNAQPFFITETTATVTSSDTVLPDPVTGTASTTSVSPSGATLSAEASSGGSGGSGTLTVAQYSGDPIGTNSSPGTSAFSTPDSSGYFNVYVAPGSSFTSVTLEYADTGGTTLYWWDGAAWSLVSNQSYNPLTGVITVTVTTTSSPSIAQLTGTIFGVASGPAVNKITVAPSPNVALGNAVTLTANLMDSVAGAVYTAEVNWGDGQTTSINNVTGAQLTAPHTYTAAGSYTVKAKVARGDSFGTSTFSPLVVYSTAAGWVTGGGWFNSPLGSLTASPSFTGKTFFQLGVKYQQGASVPSALNGLTLDASNMKFEATRYDWLIVVGAVSQFGGAGTVNGVGGYDFLVTGFDGKLEGKQVPDKLRVKVWNHSTGQIVYDNQAGAPNTAPAAVALGGGNMTVHK